MHSYIFSVAISWGNKMNFSLSANMSGFCSDSHYVVSTGHNITCWLHVLLEYINLHGRYCIWEGLPALVPVTTFYHIARIF